MHARDMSLQDLKRALRAGASLYLDQAAVGLLIDYADSYFLRHPGVLNAITVEPPDPPGGRITATINWAATNGIYAGSKYAILQIARSLADDGFPVELGTLLALSGLDESDMAALVKALCHSYAGEDGVWRVMSRIHVDYNRAARTSTTSELEV